jgi:hypothetical protein
MRRLVPPRPPARPDLSASLLATVGLMMLLLPVLLVTSSPTRLTSSALRLLDGGGAQPPHNGPLASVEVIAAPEQLTVLAYVQLADVRARPEQAERRETVLPHTPAGPDLVGLQRSLRQLHRLDPSQRAIQLRPADTLDVATWAQLMDAVRSDAAGPLFPDVRVEDPG